MRISDWSSDVCSSDLGEKARLLLAFTAGVSAMAFAFAFNLLLERMRNRTPSLMDMSYEEESITTFNRADTHPDAPPRRPIFRSEEHTSELHSLLRNTYAVFCLTKKITTSTAYIT